MQISIELGFAPLMYGQQGKREGETLLSLSVFRMIRIIYENLEMNAA